MTDDLHEKMFRPASSHSDNCFWGVDQYWWECTCGAVPVAEITAEMDRRRVALIMSERE